MREVFLNFGDLPLHPLAVHFAVALFPLAVIGLIVATVWKKARDKYLTLAVAAVALTLPLVFMAQQSGEALSEVFYEPQPHSEYGEQLMPLALATVATGVVLVFSLRRNWNKMFSQLVAVAIVPLGTASLAMTFVVGHSGADAVWAGKITPQSEQGMPLSPSEEVSTTAPADNSQTQDSAMVEGISAVEVGKHSTQSDCWVVIDGAVYQLDGYMSKHPGGKAVLTSLCGKDGSAAFNNQHARQALPETELEKLKRGLLATGQTQQPADAQQPSETGTAKGSIFSETDILAHASAADCWTVVNETVYNLSGYANEHPGGASQIQALCGKDATSAFSNEHGFGGVPANVLAAMAIGTIDATVSLPPTEIVYGEADEEEEDD